MRISELRRAGYVRATSTAPTLRAYGFEVIMARVPVRRRRVTSEGRPAPWAKKWAVDLVKKLRGLRLPTKIRKSVLEEALDLGRPGPLAEAAFIAGRMMQ